MLVLTRKVDETVNVYHAGRLVARVVLCRVDNQAVRLGFAAGPEVTFVRDEIDDMRAIPAGGESR